MNSLNLDILIPTCDRPEQINSRLDEIALQFGFNQRVHVQVNPGVYDASGIHLSHSQQALTVAQVNVGFVANVLCEIARLNADWLSRNRSVVAGRSAMHAATTLWRLQGKAKKA